MKNRVSFNAATGRMLRALWTGRVSTAAKKIVWHPRLLPPMLLVAAFLFIGNALYIHAKAQLAQALIARAWRHSLQSPHEPFKPWRWADTTPVLLLRWHDLDGRNNDLYVLDGANGSALAFAPGLLSEAFQNGAGLKAIAGHRDTHFAFLEHLHAGDALQVQDKSGQWRNYLVADTSIVDTTNSSLYVDPSVDALLLITCYPFHALNSGGPLRYLVKAYPAPDEPASIAAR